VADFNVRDDGTPTAAHTWDEQFLPLRRQGHTGPPPAEKLRERIAQLAAAAEQWPGHKASHGWAREWAWRVAQLQVRIKEESDADAERQV